MIKPNTMKLWQKDIDVRQEVEKFTVGKDRELDLLLAEFDVLGSLAHGIMLESIQLLTKDELKNIRRELKNIYRQIKSSHFSIEDGVEDVHSQIEFLLTKRLGETGKKIHSGRSRNDQVLLDLKLFIRSEIRKTVTNVKELFDQLILLSETHKNKMIPGYTHMQMAMPSSFGLWFGAYAESLVDDLVILQSAYKISNRNPLGSGAGYGSSFPLNRQMTTDILGFEMLSYNVVYAQMGRGKTEKCVSSALANIAFTLAKMAMDVCLYLNQNFDFIGFPDELTTGSSIMPHKKNPDAFEMIRARCNRLQALPNEITLLINNLPSGYHRDLQLTKESLLPAFQELHSCITMTSYMLKQVIVKDDILNDSRYHYLFSVEAVNSEVLKGTSFRDAYRKIGARIQDGSYQASPVLEHTHEGSIGNLCNAEIIKMMDKTIRDFNFDIAEKALNKLIEEE